MGNLLKYVYDDRKEITVQRGSKIYKFDPFCEVENQNHKREFLSLKPVTFIEAIPDNAEGYFCRFCGFEAKSFAGQRSHERKCRYNPDIVEGEDESITG